MAEIDTGLGWAANDMWLTRAANTEIARIQFIGGTLFPNQPMNAVYAISDVTTANGTASAVISGTQTQYMCNYIAPDLGYPEADILLCYVKSGSYYRRLFITNVSGAVCAQQVWDSASQRYRFSGTTAAGNSYSSTYNLYYRQETDNRNIGYVPADIPVFDTQNQAFAAVQRVSTTFSKDIDGFAVACVARWKTSANIIISTPILISSDSGFTDMTDSSGTYNIAKLNILRQGMRFYMSFFDITDAVPTTSFPVLDLTGDEENPRSLEQIFATIADLDHAAILVLDAPDPYQEESEESGEEGGDGEDLEDDPIEEETLPLPSVAGHGFCTIYVPDSQELGAMASYLWSGSFDVTQVLKLFSNPMDSILGLSAVPVSLSGSPEQIYLGGVALTGITMPKYTGRTSIKVDFGTVTVKERWGSYLDYAPYTEFSIYLPFIGIKPIKADDIMGKTISLMYAIDILSGGCVAYLRPAGGSVLYEWSGQCAVQIPVTGRSYDNVFQSAMSVATATLAAVAAPASAPVLSGAVASAAVQAAASKPHIERSGTVNGITGFLGQLRPYLIRTIPEAFIPADQNKFIGYPAYINVDLGSVVGYNEVDSIHLENVTATGAELDEIETLLKGGVIF